MKKTELHKIIEKYFTVYLKHECNVSPHTILSYRDTFALLIRYFKDQLHIPAEKLSLNDLTKENVKCFLSWIVDEKGCSISTRNHRLSVIRAFVKYLQYEEITLIGECQRILTIPMSKYAYPEMSYLSVKGVRLLLSMPDTTTRHGRRDLAILALMCDTGARVQEIADLKVSSLRIDVTPYTISVLGKGRKNRVIPLQVEQVAILKHYLKENFSNNPNKQNLPLFQNSTGEKLTRAGITYILKKYTDLAHNKDPMLMPEKISCHCLRHTKAMNLLEAGVSLRIIRDILGHESISTTEIYARVDFKSKREALEKAYQETHPNLTNVKIWKGEDGNMLEWLESLH